MINAFSKRNFLKNVYNPQAWNFYRSFFPPFHRKIFLSLVIAVIQSAVFLPISYLIKYIFDVAIPSGEYYSLLLVGLAIILLQIINDGSSLLINYLVLDVYKKVIAQIRESLLAKLYTFSRAYYTNADQGELHTVIVQDTERLDLMTYYLLGVLAPKLLISTVLLVILFFLNWFLTVIILCSVPIVLFTSQTLGRRVKTSTNIFHDSFEQFSTGIMFVMQVMDFTRLISAEKHEIQRQNSNFEELRSTSMHMGLAREVYFSVDTVIMATVSMVVLVAGGRAVAVGQMSLGDLITFYAVVMFLKQRATAISKSIPAIIEGNESLTSIYNLLKTSHMRPYSGCQTLEFKGKITLENVSFSYTGIPTVTDISMVFEPGSRTAVIGPNGSGKTTISNLILAFYRPQQGRIFADNMPYEDMDINQFRQMIAVVTQDPILFSGTVYENIAYGHPELSRKDVEKAADLASAHDYIIKLPNGYDTHIGKDGKLISGGQRQRIAIARAFLRPSRLLILDEPTNHLDAQSVELVMNNINSMKIPPTIIFISHDLNPARSADHIYMLDDGKIVNQGSYISLSESANLNLRQPIK